jgi:hypothetical protein
VTIRSIRCPVVACHRGGPWVPIEHR